jgi:DNA mismatch repair protein MutL
MSGIIKLLPDHIANQIAAGEVIQRPASVVKEMVENAIDAGATKIQVFIKDAGKTLIQIIDNGDGMNESDAILCFERHATSKVANADDLFALKTKGFRGEALASIAAISHVTLKTRQASSETGTLLEIEGSKIVSNDQTVCSVGTSFEVKNLFYNVPARRNFLKSENVEFNHIKDEFERIVYAHPEIAFTLKHNETEIYQLNPAILRKRIVDILGRNSNDKLVPIEETTEIVELKGYIGKPEFSKKTRGEQFLFVNNRFFKDTYFNHALNKAFDGLLPSKHFASYFLYLTVDPAKIDVNVHPTKTEIKFEEDRLIYSIIFSSVRQALGKYNIAPTLDFDRETSFDLPFEMRNMPATEPQVKVNPFYNPFQSNTATSGASKGNQFTKAIHSEGFGTKDIRKADWDAFYAIEEEEKSNNSLIEADHSSFEMNDFLFKGRYLITTGATGILLIDIPRAFERIIYDELMAKFIGNPIASQKLLFPIEKEFSSAEITEWESNTSLLGRFGFEWKFDKNMIVIEAVPAVLQEESIHDCIDTVLAKIAFQDIDKGEIAHALVLSIASSVGKTKKISNSVAARDLMEQLFLCPEHAITAEGKRVMQTISLDELSKRF